MFVATNLAVLAVVAVALHLLVVQGMLDERGIGVGGSVVSLLLAKRSAERLTGARVISTPRTLDEHWLVETVRRQVAAAGIGMPEAATSAADDPNAFATGARRDRAIVAVSERLLRRMEREEVGGMAARSIHGKRTVARWFSTHPPIEERIEALRRAAL